VGLEAILGGKGLTDVVPYFDVVNTMSNGRLTAAATASR
jgi:hypothetical protein